MIASMVAHGPRSKFSDQNFLVIVSETFDLGNGETEFLKLMQAWFPNSPISIGIWREILGGGGGGVGQ